MEAIMIFVVGTFVGSFINSLESRVRLGGKIFLTRSCCRNCQKKLPWPDIIPLVSFLFLRGRCRYCRALISWQYPAIELASGLLWLFAWHMNGTPEFSSGAYFARPVYFELSRQWLIVSLAVFIFIYDLKYQEVADGAACGGAALIFLLSLFTGQPKFFSMLIGAVAAAGFFLWQYLVSRGQWLGGGDIRIGLLLGVALGWPAVLIALALAYIIGALLSLGLVLAKRQALTGRTPFGAYLSLALLITLWFGQDIIAGWLKRF